MTILRQPRFGQKAAERAHDEWGCNCGPGAIAAICHLTLDEVRPLLLQGDFEHKGYVSPTLMKDVMASLHFHGKVKSWSVARNVDGRHCDLDWPRYGLARIQWEGPWSAPGMNPRWGYRHTHWVGAARRPNAGQTRTLMEESAIGIFDINCMQNGSGWVDLFDWQEMVVPWLLKNCVPRANGKWHITHAIEVTLPIAAGAVA